MPLFNGFLYDGYPYNGADSVGTTYLTDRVVFENFSLSDGSVMICTDILDSGPTREIVGNSVPRGDGSYVVADYFRERTIEAVGWVKKTSAATLDAFLDTIRKSVNKREGNLDITDANGTAKRFLATCDNYDQMFAARKGYDITICPFDIKFVCKTPVGYARTYTTAFLASQTATVTQTCVNGGTYKTFPVFFISLNAATSITEININNVTTGEQIDYAGAVTAGDLFCFDGELKQVTKNGTKVAFTGTFPTLAVGSNNVALTITGTSYSCDWTLKWRSAWL